MKDRVVILIGVFIISIFIFSSVSALENYRPETVNQEFNFTQTCQDASYITLSTIITPNGTEVINQNMTPVGGGSFIYNYTAGQVSIYDFTGISDGCLKTFAVFVPVTADGKVYDTGDSLMRIFISIFFIFMMVAVYKLSESINYDKWYDRIKDRYITKNFVKWSLAAICFNIMKNAYIIYFLLGLPIFLILMDLVFIYNIASVELYVKSLLYLYIAFIAVLGVVFLGYLQEWFVEFIEEIEDIEWGIDSK